MTFVQLVSQAKAASQRLSSGSRDGVQEHLAAAARSQNTLLCTPPTYIVSTAIFPLQKYTNAC